MKPTPRLWAFTDRSPMRRLSTHLGPQTSADAITVSWGERSAGRCNAPGARPLGRLRRIVDSDLLNRLGNRWQVPDRNRQPCPDEQPILFVEPPIQDHEPVVWMRMGWLYGSHGGGPGTFANAAPRGGNLTEHVFDQDDRRRHPEMTRWPVPTSHPGPPAIQHGTGDGCQRRQNQLPPFLALNDDMRPPTHPTSLPTSRDKASPLPVSFGSAQVVSPIRPPRSHSGWYNTVWRASHESTTGHRVPTRLPPRPM